MSIAEEIQKLTALANEPCICRDESDECPKCLALQALNMIGDEVAAANKRIAKWRDANATQRTDIDVMASVRESLVKYAATWQALADR